MPETTAGYHRIPVSPRKEGDRIRTIVISEKDGIKALYAANRKIILTYLFDVNKWTMVEAKAWVKAHTKSSIKEEKVEDYKIEKSVAIKKIDMEKGIFGGEVYVPNEVDTQGDFMSIEEIEKLAHRFLVECRKIDVQHNQEEVKVYPVESFIVRENDPDFSTPGGWVLLVKTEDKEILRKVENGEITAFSFQGLANAEAVE